MACVLQIGAGGVGGVVAHKMAMNRESFTRIILASRTLSKCQAIVDSIREKGLGEIEIDSVDADSVESVVALIEKYRPKLVVNVALPYQDLSIMEACLRTKTHYLDTANYEHPDSAHFEYKEQWAYDTRYKQAGIFALLGSGFDPGVTNVFCAYAQKHYFDEIHSIDILDCNAGDHGYAFATNFNPEINLREVSSKARYWVKEGHSVLSDKSGSASSCSLQRTLSASHSQDLHNPDFSSQSLECQDSHKVDSSSPQNIVAKVLDTQKYFGLNLSKVVATSMLKAGDLVKAQVDSSRFEIAKHHSATHLLHYALRQILGSHIAQAGSLVEVNRLRFDFSHPKALNTDELEQIEALVNSKIAESSPQVCETMGITEAKAKGAMALFGEKYGENVRVISFGDSIELCGGIHIQNTAEIGSFYIVRESSVSSGVRRIEAVCGKAAYHYGKNALESIKQAKEALKAQDIIQGIFKLKEQLKELKEKASKSSTGAQTLESKMLNGVKLIALKLENTDTKEAKELVDNAKNENEKVAILLITESSGKVTITAGVKGVESKLKAGAWVKQVAQILGGNGGGRDDFATAGGKITDSNKIKEALELAEKVFQDIFN
ncbi:saccharopine dehydrogenase NADP-binding domain-containing protein [Helicobacter winghamensis]|uniref:saccharopine dehydrogenase NADP-binding domain-containing protein n=1 Tax=Helicobacter winghamensis TaxID=157268 RepID=UPI00242BDD45|nr:saccharopine dehydrogenase NADP-binding domain-containing protein [Helicobacter winghamensis]